MITLVRGKFFGGVPKCLLRGAIETAVSGSMSEWQYELVTIGISDSAVGDSDSGSRR